METVTVVAVVVDHADADTGGDAEVAAASDPSRIFHGDHPHALPQQRHLHAPPQHPAARQLLEEAHLHHRHQSHARLWTKAGIGGRIWEGGGEGVGESLMRVAQYGIQDEMLPWQPMICCVEWRCGWWKCGK